MKKQFLLSAWIIALIFAGCGPKDAETTDIPVPPGMIAYDMSEFGMSAIIHLPDSTSGMSDHMATGDGAMLRVGKNFGIKVKVGAGEMDYMKNEIIAKSEVYKLDKYLLETPEAIIWQWHIEGQEPEIRMFAVIKAGDQTYEVETDPDGKFSEEACKKMLECAKSIRPKPAPAKAES